MLWELVPVMVDSASLEKQRDGFWCYILRVVFSWYILYAVFLCYILCVVFYAFGLFVLYFLRRISNIG